MFQFEVLYLLIPIDFLGWKMSILLSFTTTTYTYSSLLHFLSKYSYSNLG